jgi:hypothetical protein
MLEVFRALAALHFEWKVVAQYASRSRWTYDLGGVDL